MFVVKIGGSILFDDHNQINEKLISNYANTIRNVFSGSKNKCAIVVGGGKTARKYISAARALGASDSFNDIIGIEVARLNAQLVIASLQELAYPEPPKSFLEFQSLFNLTDKILVVGGFQPGQSTNAVAATIAEATKAKKLINLTDVNGVYTADPDKDPSAKLIDKMTIDELIELIVPLTTQAGHYPLFDFTAAQIIKRSKINLHFINGTNSDNLRKAVENEKIGTQIIHI